jgi:DNA-directed RNA polymerase subunit RPC12/RpoP
MFYSRPHYIQDNGNGYSLEERDALCSKCGKSIGRQVKYKNIDKEFSFSDNEKAEYKHCPYCGERL